MGYCSGLQDSCECSNNAIRCSANKNCKYEQKLKEKKNGTSNELRKEGT